MYAKDDSDKWYTSKQTDTKKWCELVLPQYQKAVDTLIKGCPTTIEPIKLSIKPIDTTVQPSQSEIQLTPKQQIQMASKGLDYIQNNQNKPV
jgi:coenzyme F420-reducing hydrogenase gamma subunit